MNLAKKKKRKEKKPMSFQWNVQLCFILSCNYAESCVIDIIQKYCFLLNLGSQSTLVGTFRGWLTGLQFMLGCLILPPGNDHCWSNSEREAWSLEVRQVSLRICFLKTLKVLYNLGMYYCMVIGVVASSHRVFSFALLCGNVLQKGLLLFGSCVCCWSVL